MLKKLKRVTVVVVALILSVLMGACAPAAPTATSPTATSPTATSPTATGPAQPKLIRIGWVPPDITGVFRTATDYFNMAAADARKHGINVDIITQSPVSHTAFADQVAIIEDFVARKLDAIVISPIEVEPVIPAIKKANEAGIPVIIVNLLEPIEGVKVASYIGFDNTVAGEISAYAMIDYLGGPGVLGKGEKVQVDPSTYLDINWWENLYKNVDPKTLDIKANVAIIEGIAGGFFSTARLNGFHKVIDQYPGIKVVASMPADWNREKAISVTEDILSSHPAGTLDVIWAASNEMGLGAMLTCENANRLALASDPVTVGGPKVAVFTNDGTPESADRIREGKLIAETIHGFPDWGWYGTAIAIGIVYGCKVPQTFDIRPRTMYKDNVDMFYPNPALKPIDWEAIKRGEFPSF